MTAFLAAIVTLGAIALFDSMLLCTMSVSGLFLLLVIFACIAAPHAQNLGHNAWISTLHPFVLSAIVLFGVREAVLLAGISMIYAWLVERPRPRAFKAAFNVCNFVLSAWLSAQVYVMSGGAPGDVTPPTSLAALLLAVTTFFFVNTGLVSIAIGLEQKIDPLRVWREKYSWTINSFVAGGAMAVFICMLVQGLGPMILFLLGPFCILVYHFYGIYSQRALRRGHHP